MGEKITEKTEGPRASTEKLQRGKRKSLGDNRKNKNRNCLKYKDPGEKSLKRCSYQC